MKYIGSSILYHRILLEKPIANCLEYWNANRFWFFGWSSSEIKYISVKLDLSTTLVFGSHDEYIKLRKNVT